MRQQEVLAEKEVVVVVEFVVEYFRMGFEHGSVVLQEALLPTDEAVTELGLPVGHEVER